MLTDEFHDLFSSLNTICNAQNLCHISNCTRGWVVGNVKGK
jgi:hypothetical protein